jgi:hypothetical protein
MGVAVASLRAWPLGEVFRDISRGGLAGLLTGIVVAGIGGRLVMRAAAIIVPSATGLVTESGNRIGEVTIGGTFALISVQGLGMGVIFGVVWVVISPWLPRPTVVRGVVAMPIAVGLSSHTLIDRFNPDFALLGHNPLVVAILVALVASVAPALAIFDRWLDRCLPRAVSIGSRAGVAYTLLTLIGVALGGLLTFLVAPTAAPTLAFTIVAMGIVTLAWWILRARESDAPPGSLRLTALAILVLGTLVGYVEVVRNVAGALDL